MGVRLHTRPAPRTLSLTDLLMGYEGLLETLPLGSPEYTDAVNKTNKARHNVAAAKTEIRKQAKAFVHSLARHAMPVFKAVCEKMNLDCFVAPTEAEVSNENAR